MRQREKKIMTTMKDIADAAGVSRTTVSFVLNKRPEADSLTKETREKVLRIADELGYCRNQIALSMLTGKTNVIGLVINPPRQEYIGKLLSGVIDAAEKQNYLIKFFQTSAYSDVKTLVQKLRGQNVDGVITFGFPYGKLTELFNALKAVKIPMGAVGNSPDLEFGLQTISDDEDGVYQAMQYLYDNNHQEICFIDTSSEIHQKAPTTIRRYRGYSSFIKKHHLNHYSCHLDELTDILINHPQVTAFISHSHILIAQAARIIKSQGKQIPEDCSIVGYSQCDLTRYFDPPITTVDQPHYNMGKNITERLIDHILRDDQSIFSQNKLETLPTQLITGESVGKNHEK